MKKTIAGLLIFLVVSQFSAYGQRALSEKVDYYDVRMPNNPLDESVTGYKVVVETPYTLTVDQLNAQTMAEFEQEKANFANTLEQSKLEFEDKLNNYDEEVKLAKERYEQEMKEFKSLSLLERLAITDQGKQPKLKIPVKPTYVEPLKPQYVQPNLDNHLIFDDQVLADGIELLGYEKGKDIMFIINVSKMVFQDNAGQTFYSQPTTLKVMKGAEVIDETVFDNEFEFLTSSSSNTINLDRYEKDNVKKIMKNINTYINEEFGYIPVLKSISIEYPKNKKREYDDLENAKIKAVSAYRKLNKDTSLADREKAISILEDVRKVWKSELERVDYSNKKATMNAKVSRMILFNLMRVDLTLKDKAQAEETLELIQEHRIDLDLGYYEKEELTKLEEEVYKL
jgi:hypothetical protein